MPETVIENVDLEALKQSLPYGGQRTLAKRLGATPDKISKALDGFIKDPEFMSRLQAEAHKLINGDEAVSDAEN